MKYNKTGLLSFSYSVDGLLKVKDDELISLLNSLKEFELIHKKDKIMCMIKTKESKEYMVVEFSENKIMATCYLEEINIQSKNLLFLKFLTLLDHLKGAYDIRLESLYGKLEDAIISSNLTSGSGKSPIDLLNERRADELSNSNLILSIELRNLINDIADKKFEITTYKEFCTEIIEKVAGNAVALQSLGVKENVAKNVLELINKNRG
jgi:hypothetical protein